MHRVLPILLLVSLACAQENEAPKVDLGAVLRKSADFNKKCATFRVSYKAGEVRAIGEVAYRGGGPCEYLINVAPAKAHETVVLLDDGPPKDDERRGRENLDGFAGVLNNAFIAAGFTRGKPFAWNDETGEVFNPQGEAVHIYAEWKDEKSGATKRALMSDWLWNFKTTHTMEPKFVYTGSMWIEHEGKKYFGADLDGLVVAVLNTSTAIIDHSEDGALENGAYEAIPIRIPPTGTRVTVVFTKEPLGAIEKYPPMKLPEELVKKRAEYVAALKAGKNDAAAKKAQQEAAREKAAREKAVKEREEKGADEKDPEKKDPEKKDPEKKDPEKKDPEKKDPEKEEK